MLLLVYPLWFPWVLQPVAAGVGVRFDTWAPKGYGRCELSKFSWSNAVLSVCAERVVVQMPHRWLWSRWTGAMPSEPQVVVTNWRIEQSPEEPGRPRPTGSTAAALDEIQRVYPQVGSWVRSVRLTDGEVRLLGKRLSVPWATWREGALSLRAWESSATIDLTSLPRGPMTLAVSNRHALAEVQARRADGDWTFEGAVFWQSNRFDLQGAFGRSDWLPARAFLQSDSLHLSGLPSGVHWSGELQGSCVAAWSNGRHRFRLDLADASTGKPVGSQDRVSVRLTGEGDLETVRIEELDLQSPLGRATLAHPVTLDYAGRVRAGSAALEVSADLGRLQPVPLSGLLSGRIELQPGFRFPLRGQFNLEGQRVSGFRVTADSLAVSGILGWPNLECTNLHAVLPSGAVLTANLVLDLEERRVKGLQWQLNGTNLTWPAFSLASIATHESQGRAARRRGPGAGASAPRFLVPARDSRLAVASFHAQGRAEGAWPTVSHTGRVEMSGIEVGPFRAANVLTTWTGRGLRMEDVQTRVQSGQSTLEGRGQGSLARVAGGLEAAFDVDSFDWRAAGRVWRLKESVRLQFQRTTNVLVFDLAPLELEGPEGSLALQATVHWPSNGSGRLQFSGLRSADLQDFLNLDLAGLGLTVPEVHCAFRWDNGPLAFEVRVQARLEEGTGTVWSLDCDARSEGDHVRLDPVCVALDGTPVALAKGRMPIAIHPSHGWRISGSTGGEGARLDVNLMEDGPWWRLLEQKTGLRVVSPVLDLEVVGRVPDVEGRLSFRALQVEFTRTNGGGALTLPRCENLRLEGRIGIGGLRETHASAELLGQRIEAELEWKLAASNWLEWVEAVVDPDWTQLSGSVRMEGAELGALAALAPGILAPVGTMNLALALHPGLKVRGHLNVTNAATRPFEPMGALRDIHADIRWQGWDVVIDRCEARLAGRPLRVDGTWGWRSNGDHRFNLRLLGKDLSLVREPDLFVRADVDLRAEKAFGEQTRVSGDVQLQRSLLFRDFNALVGFDREQAGQRPPYFRISEPPFGDWQLDLRVRGDRFLRVISPAFKGEVSAGLQLLGTLREPFAVGAVTVDAGKLLFPFGTLELESGRVDLTREDPYQPQLDFRGIGQNYGYTITLNLRGPIEALSLTFQSVPPLTAQQILLMLTAGEIPRSDFGYSATDKAGRVGFYVGKEFVNRFLGSTSTSERLSLRMGEYITDEGKPTYSLQYRLSDRWSAFGEYDRFRDFNSGLRFKVLSK